MKAFLLSNRSINLLGLSICLLSLLIAIFYMEKVLQLKPCPLCILSRYVVVIMAVFFSLGFLDNQRYLGPLVYTSINLLWAILGIAIAGRHMWLQSHPALTCTIGSVSGIVDFITKAFAGTSDCSINQWKFLGMTVPEQTLVLFVALTFLLSLQLYLCLKRPKMQK